MNVRDRRQVSPAHFTQVPTVGCSGQPGAIHEDGEGQNPLSPLWRMKTRSSSIPGGTPENGGMQYFFRSDSLAGINKLHFSLLIMA
jgi:hypothetical protein